MVIHLPNAKLEQKQVGRNFVWSLEQKKAHDTLLKAENAKMFKPLNRRLTKLASAEAGRIVFALKAELTTRKIKLEEVGQKQLRMMDSFIVNRLPIPPETKRLALKKMAHEAVLTDYFAASLLGGVIKKADAISMLDKAITDAENLHPPYRDPIQKTVNLTGLKEKLRELRRAGGSTIKVDTNLILRAKTVNTATVREVLGEEMSNIYAAVYKEAKLVVSSEILRQYEPQN